MNLLNDKTVLILGLGLIGGSIARGLCERNLCRRVIAHGRDESTLQAAMLDGNIQAYSTDLATLVPEADLILIAVPTLSVRAALEQLAPLIDDKVIISDAASVKGSVVADARAVLDGRISCFVPGHPIAGSEKSGYRASRADLYEQRKVILTPLPENNALAVRTVMQMWQGLGAEVHAMSPARHDAVLAGTSHLPHLLAFALVNTLVDHVSEPDRAQQVFDYAAGGFADFSRIASSDPIMWRDIFLSNTHATVDMLDAFIKTLQGMRQLILRADADTIQHELMRAREVHEEFIRRFRDGDSHSPMLVQRTTRLTARPGLSLRGTFRAPASAQLAAQVLKTSATSEAVLRYDGFPEDMITLSRVKALRDQGVPIVGPEKGKIVIYGHSSTDAGGPEPSETCRLPADEILSSCLILAAAAVPASLLQLEFVEWLPAVPEAAESGRHSCHLADYLQQLGADIRVLDQHTNGCESVDLEVKSSALQGKDLDLSSPMWSVDQLLCVLAACLLAKGESKLRLADGRLETLLERCAGWISLGSLISKMPDQHILITGSPLHAGEIECNGDLTLSLLTIVLAQRATGHIELVNPGDIAGENPGLLAELGTLGFGLSLRVGAT